MSETLPSSSAPVTEAAFLADRQRFWASFTGFILLNVVTVVVILVLMAIFLL